MGIIRKQIVPDSVVCSDRYQSCNILDVPSFMHYRINHPKRFAVGNRHINGNENFWNQAKRQMRKFNGISKEHFSLFLKE